MSDRFRRSEKLKLDVSTGRPRISPAAQMLPESPIVRRLRVQEAQTRNNDSFKMDPFFLMLNQPSHTKKDKQLIDLLQDYSSPYQLPEAYHGIGPSKSFFGRKK